VEAYDTGVTGRAITPLVEQRDLLERSLSGLDELVGQTGRDLVSPAEAVAEELPTATPTPVETIVDINTATEEELLQVPGIGRTFVQRIIAERANARFTDLDNLVARIKGAGDWFKDNIGPHFKFQPEIESKATEAVGVDPAQFVDASKIQDDLIDAIGSPGSGDSFSGDTDFTHLNDAIQDYQRSIHDGDTPEQALASFKRTLARRMGGWSETLTEDDVNARVQALFDARPMPQDTAFYSSVEARDIDTFTLLDNSKPGDIINPHLLEDAQGYVKGRIEPIDHSYSYGGRTVDVRILTPQGTKALAPEAFEDRIYTPKVAIFSNEYRYQIVEVDKEQRLITVVAKPLSELEDAKVTEPPTLYTGPTTVAQDAATRVRPDDWLTWMYKDSREAIPKYAEQHGMTVNEYLDYITKQFQNEFADTTVKTRISPQILSKVLDDGRFKSQVEVGRSGGYFDAEYRKAVDKTLFNFAEDGPDAERPIYGYITKADEIVDAGDQEQYGSAIIILKDSASAKTTMTMDDSLLTMQGSRLPNTFLARPLEQIDWTVTRYDLRDPFDVPFLGGKSYVEAQIHGGVGLSDIDHIVFTMGKPAGTLIKKLDAAGIPWEVSGESFQKLDVVVSEYGNAVPQIITGTYKYGAGFKVDGWEEFWPHQLLRLDPEDPLAKSIVDYYNNWMKGAKDSQSWYGTVNSAFRGEDAFYRNAMLERHLTLEQAKQQLADARAIEQLYEDRKGLLEAARKLAFNRNEGGSGTISLHTLSPAEQAELELIDKRAELQKLLQKQARGGGMDIVEQRRLEALQAELAKLASAPS
jgi:hypothetical protein